MTTQRLCTINWDPAASIFRIELDDGRSAQVRIRSGNTVEHAIDALRQLASGLEELQQKQGGAKPGEKTLD